MYAGGSISLKRGARVPKETRVVNRAGRMRPLSKRSLRAAQRRRLRIVGRARVSAAGAYRVTVRLPAGRGKVAVRTRAAGTRARSYSLFVVR